MPDQHETSEQLLRLLQARVPLIVIRTVERTRALDVIDHVASQVKSMPFYVHSRARGLVERGQSVPVSDDRSLVGAFDFAASTFASRMNSNFVFTDIDDLDSETQTSRHVAETVRLAEERQGSIIVISAQPVWSGLARLGMTITLDLPTADELAAVIRDLVDDHRPDTRMNITWGDEEIRRAAEILQGVTRSEAVNILTTQLASLSLTADDLHELSKFKDQIFGDVSGIDKIRLRDDDYGVGGLSSLREWLRDKRELMFADLGGTHLHAPKGVLLAGVPGCGKSLSAKAIAAEWQLPLYRLDMASVLGMYVGQSESRLKEALEAADRVAPCVLWIDEIEKGFASGSGDSGTSRRLIGQFLFWLQESTSKVFIVATANEVISLPPELLRKGRFDEVFFVDLPDEEDRREIVRMYLTRYQIQTEPDPALVEDLVSLSDGFSGADIESVVHDIGAAKFKNGEEPSESFMKDLFRNVMPFSRTNPEELASIRAWGRERAVPAGRMGSVDAAAAAGGRRVVVME